MTYIHNNGYLEPVPKVEKPFLPDHYDAEVYVRSFRAYNAWLAARIPVANCTTWEDREYDYSEIHLDVDDRAIHKHSRPPVLVAYPLPVVEEEKCTHEPLIDTGVGYYHCPACNTGFTYNEWFSKTKPADPLDIPRFTVQQAAEDFVSKFCAPVYYHGEATHKAAYAGYMAGHAHAGEGMKISPEQLAQRFHEIYEKLAPQFGYETRKESAKPWSEVPEQNKQLMIAVCKEIVSESPSDAVEPDRFLAALHENLSAMKRVKPENEKEIFPHGSVTETVVETYEDIIAIYQRMAKPDAVESAGAASTASQGLMWETEVNRLRKLLLDTSYAHWKGLATSLSFQEWQNDWIKQNRLSDESTPTDDRAAHAQRFAEWKTKEGWYLRPDSNTWENDNFDLSYSIDDIYALWPERDKVEGQHFGTPMESALAIYKDGIPDFTNASDEEKKVLINGLCEVAGTHLLAFFMACGLKTHISCFIKNGDETFKLLFEKVNSLSF